MTLRATSVIGVRPRSGGTLQYDRSAEFSCMAQAWESAQYDGPAAVKSVRM